MKSANSLVMERIFMLAILGLVVAGLELAVNLTRLLLEIKKTHR